MKKLINEQLELLIKDLCARLPYGVKIGVGVETDAHDAYILLGINPTACGCAEMYIARNGVTCSGSLENMKPYLRQMSSMTEEEYEEYSILWNLQDEFPTDADLRFKIDVFDWLNAHRFDYRGLIEKGLALEAPEGMYNV